MNTHSTQEHDHDSDPELIADLTQLFQDRASRFEERPMSYERLQAAVTVRPTGRRVDYLLAVAAILLVVGPIVGLIMWGGTEETSPADPLRAVVVTDEDEGRTEPDISTDATDDPDGGRSVFDDLTPSTTGLDGEATDSTSDPDDSSRESSNSATSDPANPDATSDTTTSTADATTPTSTTAPSTTTTIRESETTTATAGQQLASPSLGPVVPHFTNVAPSKSIGQVQLSSAFNPVPGAARYEIVYSMDGSEISRFSSDSATATTWHQGAPGREYCLRVVATSPTRPNSDPSVVCSVNASAMNIVMTPVNEGDPPEISAFDVSWTAVGPAARYEVLTGVNGQTYELVTVSSQPRAQLDLNGRTGSFCVILRALDAGGNRIQSAAECTDVLP